MVKFNKKKITVFIISMMILSSVLTAAGINIYMHSTDRVLVSKSAYEENQEIAERYRKLYFIQNEINKNFLWETDLDQQMEYLYKSVVNSLGDKYSEYMTKEEFAKWEDMVTGKFTGIGIRFAADDKNQFLILMVNEKSPAEAAGLKAGDIILKVDGKSFETADQASEAIKGEAGTTVKILYSRDGKQKEVEIVRAELEEQSVFSTEKEGTGYIRISSFESNTAKQFKEHMSAFENKNLKGVVIDLRNNPGGMVDSAVEIADYLLPECTITHTEDNKGKKQFYNSDEKHTKTKYVLLVNENTASAAEILAAAVKENSGGKLVGKTTYGKGIIQSSAMLQDGSALKLTIMQYFSPDNNKIHKIGVSPDVDINLPDDAKEDLQLLEAFKQLSM